MKKFKLTRERVIDMICYAILIAGAITVVASYISQ
jgi:hypothetical protein